VLAYLVEQGALDRWRLNSGVMRMVSTGLGPYSSNSKKAGLKGEIRPTVGQ